MSEEIVSEKEAEEGNESESLGQARLKMSDPTRYEDDEDY